MLRLSDVGNGCTRTMRPHGRVLAAGELPLVARLDPVLPVPGEEVMTSISWSSARQLLDDASDDRAGRSDVGSEVRRDDDEPHSGVSRA